MIVSRGQPWPPALEDHAILEPWRPMHPEDLAELRERAGLGPCEGIECIARSRETGRRELVTALRPAVAAAPVRADDVRERVEAVRRVIGGGR